MHPCSRFVFRNDLGVRRLRVLAVHEMMTQAGFDAGQDRRRKVPTIQCRSREIMCAGSEVTKFRVQLAERNPWDLG